MERQRYPSDLTDAQWEELRKLIPPPKPGGRPRTTDMREVINAILYVLRTGCQWAFLPREFPPKSTVYDYFWQWGQDGHWQTMHDCLRRLVRAQAGRAESPSAAVIDSQTVKTTEKGAPEATMAARRSPAASGTSSSTRSGCS
jgi:putative transposase